MSESYLGLQRPQFLDVAADLANVGGYLCHLVEELLEVHLGVGGLPKVYDGPRLKRMEHTFWQVNKNRNEASTLIW